MPPHRHPLIYLVPVPAIGTGGAHWDSDCNLVSGWCPPKMAVGESLRVGGIWAEEG